MAVTVNSAFNTFMKDSVNLDSEQVAQARTSRNWLVKQINKFPEKHDDFPVLYEDKHFGFGSFARSTKKRDLDDIDHLICMNAQQLIYTEVGDTIYINVNDDNNPFSGFLQTDTRFLSSIKIVNRFVKYLSDIPQYKKAEIKRNQEAATLQLSTYIWNFDIVPCFYTKEDHMEKTYYIIPDGKGHWKKTDPRLDKERTTQVNQLHNGNVLQVIRAMKYWNKRQTMSTMGSYLLENMILDYYDIYQATQWVDLEVKDLLLYIERNIYSSVSDPKGIQGNINTLSNDEKESIRKRAQDDYKKAVEAIQFETSNPAYAIGKWASIFGPKFPTYG